MKRIFYAPVVLVLFLSCNKLPDFFPPSGTTQFNKVLGGSSDDAAYAVTKSLDGGYVIAGMTQSTDGDASGGHSTMDVWVVKLNKQGNKVWQQSLGGSNVDRAYSIIADWDGGYVIAGQTLSSDGDVSDNHGGSDAWVAKVDKHGNKVWQGALGGKDMTAPTDLLPARPAAT